MKSNLFVLPLTFMLSISCGDVLRIETNPSDIYVETSTGEAIPMSHDERECTEELSKKKTIVSHYIGDGQFSNTYLRRIILNKSFSVQSKESVYSLFSSFFTGGDFVRTSVYNQSSGLLNSSITTKKYASIPTLCKGQLYNERHTYESATAMVLQSLYMVQEKVKTIKALSSLKPIRIYIGSKIKKTSITKNRENKHTETKELINNAYYDFSEGQIVFLRQGFNQQGQIPFGRIPLWQIPFVPAHEYGHHVFSSLLTRYYKSGEFKNKRKVCFDNSEGAHTHKTRKPKRLISKNLSIAALNEGFADLFAQYTLGDGYSLAQVGCLSKSRYVKSSVFLSGEKKQLSSRRLLDFYNRNTLDSDYSCYNKTNNQDVHIIGAIIAHGFDSMMDVVAYSDQQKISMITKWMRHLNERFKSDFNETNAQSLLDRFITRFYEILLSDNKTKMNEIKDVYVAIFPEINIE